MARGKVEISRPNDKAIRLVLIDGIVRGSIRQTAFTGHRWHLQVSTSDRVGYPDGTRSFGAKRLEDAIRTAREFTSYPARRWIYMSGSHGCMPDSSGCVASREDALESLVELFSLGGRRTRELRRTGYLELRASRDGADYCEVILCSCAGCTGLSAGEECENCDAE